MSTFPEFAPLGTLKQIVPMTDPPIPPHQNLPPATFDKELAYRPACKQLEYRGDGGDLVEWGVKMPDGSFLELEELPAMPIVQAHSSLDSRGLCKVNGAIVPIASPRQAIASTRQIVDNVPMQASSGILTIAIVGGLAAIAMVITAIALNRKDADFQAFIGEKE